MSLICEICDHCYILVLAEYELMQLGKKWARVMNIEPANDEDTHNANTMADIFSSKLSQWRMFLYFNKIYEFELQPGILIKDLYIQIRLAGQTSRIPMGERARFVPNGNKGILTIDQIKMKYFFSASSDEIKSFSKTCKIEIEIINSKGGPIASGQLQPLKTCILNENDDVFRGDAFVLLFSTYTEPFSLRMTVGLTKDNNYLEDVGSYKLILYEGVVFPPDNFSTVDPLPKEWMDIFCSKMMDDEVVTPSKIYDITPVYLEKNLKDMNILPHRLFQRRLTVTATVTRKDSRASRKKLENSTSFKRKSSTPMFKSTLQLIRNEHDNMFSAAVSAANSRIK